MPSEVARRDYGPPGGTSIVAPCQPDRLLSDGDRIEAAGFEFVEEVVIDAFEENYFLRFKKKSS